MDIKISASILAANPMKMGEAIKNVERAMVDYIHIDVMDGHFVPNITMGPFIIKGIKEITKIPFDIHLMIENPDRYIADFAKVSREGDILTFHIEASSNAERTISLIRDKGLKPGVALNPSTPLQAIEHILHLADLILVMTVNPGFAGQKFMENVLPKLNKISKIAQNGMHVEVDGGITVETAPLAVRNGANIIAAASSIFEPVDTYKAVAALRESVRNELRVREGACIVCQN